MIIQQLDLHRISTYTSKLQNTPITFPILSPKKKLLINLPTVPTKREKIKKNCNKIHGIWQKDGGGKQSKNKEMQEQTLHFFRYVH